MTNPFSSQAPTLQPHLGLSGRLLVAALLALTPLVALQSAAQQSEPPEVDRELAFLEAGLLHAEATRIFEQTLEMSGDFGGYGSAAWELMSQLEPSPSVLAASFEESLIAGLEPAAAQATRSFFLGSAGRQMLWLSREATTLSGVRGLARSAGPILERMSPERLALLREIDRACFETAAGPEAAALLLGLIESVGDQVATAVNEEVEWVESPSEIEEHFAGQYRDQQFQEFAYRTSRLDSGQLQALRDFALSRAGQSFFAHRHALRLASVELMVSTLRPTLQQKVAEQLWEYEGEGEDEDEQEGEDG